MKAILTALASATLIGLAALPAPALAQSHGGGHTGGSFHGGGGSFHGGGFHGGFRGGGYYRGYGGAPFFFGGLALGAAFASPWYYDYPGYYAYPGYYGYEAVEPVPPPYAYDGPPPRAAPPPQACGAWRWDPSRDKYDWIPC